MKINKFSLNASKSEYMVIGHKRKLNRVGDDLSDLVLNNEAIKRVKTYILGLASMTALSAKSNTKPSKTCWKGA